MTSTVKAAIDELRLAYETAVASGRVEAIYPLLAEGAVMVHPGAPYWKAMAVAAGKAPFPAGAKIAIDPIEVVALSDEWAYEFGTAFTTYTPQGTKETIQLDGWKAYREVASSSPPPGGWPEA